MATFILINDWLANLVENADCESDQFMVALSNTAPGAEGTPPTGDGEGVLANVTQVAYTWCSTRNITTTSSGQAAGTYGLVLVDLTLTATGGAVGPFRYVYVYDDTVAVPVDPLVCYYDYGSSITLADGETLLIDFAAGGLFQLS
ncbi:MAG TPA: hypothetical protein VM366_09270 [Anaerolineae bacterium]|nr:hypothetical protein [Anaerolineae bacterium]